MKKILTAIFLFCGLCGNVSAQTGFFDNYGGEREHLDGAARFFLEGYWISGDTVRVRLEAQKVREYYSGQFFKRLSSSELNLPSNTYKDRHLKCDGCEILDYSLFRASDHLILEELYLKVEESAKKVELPMRSKDGKLLSVMEVSVAPKATFRLSVNGKPFDVDPKRPLPSIGEEDEVCVEVFDGRGKPMEVKSHRLWSSDAVGYCLAGLPGGCLTKNEVKSLQKQGRITRGVRLFAIDEDGRSWQYNFLLEDREDVNE